jgi:hypothetical protein
VGGIGPAGDVPRAVVLGCARYAALPDIPAAHHSVQALRSALIGPGSGWPLSRVAVLEDPAGSAKVARLVEGLLRDAADTLVFYYAGHARLSDDGDLRLAVADSDGDESTWLRASDVLGPVGAHGARDKLVVVDACFADVPPGVSDIDDLADRVERAIRVRGARTLVFCLASREAVYDDRAGGLTYLAHALVEAAPGGIEVAEVSRRVAGLALDAGRLRPERDPADVPAEASDRTPAEPPGAAVVHPVVTLSGPEPEAPAPADEDAAEPVRFRVSAPRPVRAFELVASVVVAALSLALGWTLAGGGVSAVLTALVAWATLRDEVHVAWWREVQVGDALVLHRRRLLRAFRREEAKGLAVDWARAGIERVVVGRARGLTRVTLHVSPEAGARVWNDTPFAGFGGYRYGVLSGGERGIAWPLGDVDAPVEDVASAFRAAVPAGVPVEVVLNAEPRYHRARRWVLLTYLVVFGGVLAGLAFA